MSLTPEALAALAAGALSLGFSYIPRLSDWFAGQAPTTKRLVMAGLIVVTGVGALAWNCHKAGIDVLVCVQADSSTLVETIVFALIGSQGTYLLTPPRGSSTKG